MISNVRKQDCVALRKWKLNDLEIIYHSHSYGNKVQLGKEEKTFGVFWNIIENIIC